MVVHWLGPPGAGNLAPTWFPFRMARLRPHRLQLLRVLRNRTPPDPNIQNGAGLDEVL